LSGEVSDIVRLAPDVIGVDIALSRPLRYLPGQYCKLRFRGFPARSYSPTYPLEGRPNDRVLHFHIRKFPDGIVSSALGSDIRIGHRVKVTGPFGSAFLRPAHRGSIVLVASGTGFAPMWSIAVAAIMERPQREMIFVVAARKLHSLYMHAALCRLALFPNVTIIPVVGEPQRVSHAIRLGLPTDHLPNLSANDVVYTAGAPAMTESVARLARAAGARCYADPFVSSAKPVELPTLMARVSGWINNDPRSRHIMSQSASKPVPARAPHAARQRAT
jgi:3-phenylpropionate/trans-cinnamate dioxygenase ferredoxin reductase subunit